MISLAPMPSNDPLEPGSDLIGHLAGSARPAIIHYSGEERTELSGRVTVNWATKTTHLIDSYGIVAPDELFVDLPVTWRSVALLLGAAWCDLACTAEPADAAAILTDRPDAYMGHAAEIFVTHQEAVDAALVDVDDEVLSHADQALLPVPDLIGNAATQHDQPASVDVQRGGVVINAQDLRLDATIWWAIIDAWRRSQPVVLVEGADEAQRARIIETERLD